MKAVKNAVYMSMFGSTQFTPPQTEDQSGITDNSPTVVNMDTERFFEATGS